MVKFPSGWAGTAMVQPDTNSAVSRKISLTRRGGDAERIGFPATPPDVRKVCDLPEDPLIGLLGLRPSFGAQPQLNRTHRFSGAEPPPHIRRRSREPQSLPEINDRPARIRSLCECFADLILPVPFWQS